MQPSSQLLIPQAKFKEQLSSRIEIGEQLLAIQISVPSELEKLTDKLWEWDGFNIELVKRSFDPEENEYYQELKNPTPSPETWTHAVKTSNVFSDRVIGIQNEIKDRIKILKRLLAKVDLIPVKTIDTISENEKLHSIIEFMVLQEDSTGKQCFTPNEIKQGLQTEIHVYEIQHLCKLLIDDSNVRDARSKDGFTICTKEATREAFYSQYYLRGKSDSNSKMSLMKNTNTDSVFIVHGHNEHIKESVARLIEKLDLEAIILHERPNSGQTIIEKFEKNADVGFAIILLTDDDEGKSKKDTKLNPRARQNVVLEMGYFLGALGRNRVAILHSQGVELPSDLSGILYIPIDSSGNWKNEIARELVAAGYSIDLSKLYR